MSKIYFLGGLGIDNSIVSDIQLRGKTIEFIDWERPSPEETLNSYAEKIISKYRIQESSIIIGVSFGGVIALEISKKIRLEKIVLVSSFLDPNELPWFFKTAIKLRLYLLFPPSVLKHFSFALNYFFSVRTTDDAVVLKNVIQKTDPVFLNWAIENILRFTPPVNNPNIIRVHGEADRIIHIDSAKTNYKIPNAGHFMVYNRKKEVTGALEKAVSLC